MSSPVKITNDDFKASAVARVLSIAGSDPSGGAGIQADLKAIAAAGGYGMSVITALTAQNTQGVQEIFVPPAEFLRAQLASISSDITVDAIKVGMVANAEIMAIIAEFLAEVTVPIVIDPVMVSTSGDSLLTEEAIASMRELCRLATVITPNLHELAILADVPLPQTLEEATQVAQQWAATNNTSVVVKGGHLQNGASRNADNVWVFPDGNTHLVHCPRLSTPNTHGTGCTLSSALATRLGAGYTPAAALEWATHYVYFAILAGQNLGVGNGNGPIDHAIHSRRLLSIATVTPPARGHEVFAATHIMPAGSHTQRLWELMAPECHDLYHSTFMTEILSENLREEDFDFYVAQDASFLVHFAKACLRLAVMAPSQAEQLMWTQFSIECLDDNADFQSHHRKENPDSRYDDRTAEPTIVSTNYANHIIATTHLENYLVGAASILPRLWLAAEICHQIHARTHVQNPYGSWLAVYSSPEFANSVDLLVSVVERAWASVDARTQERATHAFLVSARHEVDFTDQPFRRF